MPTVRGQQHSFSTHDWMFLWKCQRFWNRKCLNLRGLELPTFGFMPNALTIWAIRARHLQSHVFLYWLGRLRYFWSKVNIWNFNCARATAFILDTRTDVLMKVSKHTYMHITYIYAYIHICLLLIFMLWNRQAIFESKGDMLSSSTECRIQSWDVWDTKSLADWMPTHKPTELSRIKQKLELNSPSLWWVSIQPTGLHCRLAFTPG